jgi:hypothetical protein
MAIEPRRAASPNRDVFSKMMKEVEDFEETSGSSSSENEGKADAKRVWSPRERPPQQVVDDFSSDGEDAQGILEFIRGGSEAARPKTEGIQRSKIATAASEVRRQSIDNVRDACGVSNSACRMEALCVNSFIIGGLTGLC